MSKEKIINLRVEADLKKSVKKAADNDGRSMSNWIVWLIEKELKKKKLR
ncbi:MAG: hypothetical protein PVG66_07520 [Chromatiales bacterium]|jgi:uncharacterized protein (DUF1778 family)